MFVSEATILHADLDAFYASVEQRDDPRLRGRPVIVGGGVVLAASYEAKAYGVRTAMGGRQARRLCPRAIVVEPRMSAYSEASKAVFEVFEHTTPLVEGLSIDEAFLDVGGLRRLSGTPTEIAVRLRRDVLERVGLPITVGVARTKFLAKVASGVAKPDGLLVVPPDRELAFLHPLAGRAALGRRAGHRRQAPRPGDQDGRRGRPARRGGAGLDARAGVGPPPPRPRPQPRPAAGAGRPASGLDRVAARARPFAADRPTPSTPSSSGSSTASPAGCAPPAGSAAPSCSACASTTSRGRRGRTRCRAPTAQTQTILATVRALLATAMPMIERQGLTLVGVAVGNLDDDGAVQLALPFDRRSGSALDAALDDVRDRFGSAAVTRAVLLGRDQGLSVPMLPD